MLDGFLPVTPRDEDPGRGSKVGLQEFGLPFVSDPAIPKHLAHFLRRHRAEAIGQGGHTPDDRPARPDAILFNGGALTPAVVRERLVEVVASWFRDEGDYAPRVLSNASLDLAVAFGAAYYGVVRRGGGIRIGGGTARSFYVGFEADARADKPWLCVVPRDAQEGDEVNITGHDFDLLMGQPVAFPLASSSVRPQDQPGDLVPTDPDSIRELPPLVGLMRVGRKAKAERVPVSLEARITEVGTVELWCRSRTDDRRWRLQIQLRGQAGEKPPATGPRITDNEAENTVIEQSELDAAAEAIRAAFAHSNPHDPQGAARLVKRLEEVLDEPRDRWPPSALRALWDPLREEADRRFTTPRHEARWLNLCGFCLRPGTGYPLDETRIKALWPVFHVGVKHTKDLQCWAEWWILWRRVAAGLNRAHHEEIHRRLVPFLLKGGPGGKKLNRPKPEAHELAEMWRCVAALERLPALQKEALGDALLKDLKRPNLAPHVLWSLGRLGARVPLYGPANTVVHPQTAARWAEALLGRDFAGGRETDDAIFALTQLGRVSGDRARDLDETLRQRIIARLESLGADESSLRPVREYHELETAQQGQALGDALPVGLRLRTDTESDQGA